MVEKSGLLKLSDASKRARRSIVWLRRLADDGRITGKKVDGEWALDPASVDAYIADVQVREEQRLQRIEDGYKYPYTRPRVQSLKMVRAALDELHIDKQDAAIVLKVLGQIEKAWTAEYEKKYEK